MMNKTQVIKNISLINFVLFMVGYDVATSFFSIFIENIEEVSQSITIPYRGVSLIFSLLVIFLTRKEKVEYTLPMKLLLLYIFLFSVRLFYDYTLRTDINIDSSFKIKNSILYIWSLITMLSLIKSCKFINLSKAFYLIFTGFSIIILINYFTISEFSFSNVIDDQRITAGVRSSIDTGYNAVFFLLLSFYLFKNKTISKLLKIFTLPVASLALMVLLRSGSRGPIMALVIIIFIFIILKQKNYFLILFVFALIISLLYYFIYDIIGMIEIVAPVMAKRLLFTIEVGGGDSRFLLIREAFNGFIDNPFFGSNAMIYNPSEIYGIWINDPTFPHQLIVEAFMSTGIIGGVSLSLSIYFIVKMIFLNLKNMTPDFWLDLLVLSYVFRAMTAGSMFSFTYPIIFTFYLLKK